MARDSGGGSGIIKIALIGGGAWIGYNYLVSSGLWGQWFGTAIPPASLPVGTPAGSATPAAQVAQPVASNAPAPAPAPALAPVSRAALLAAAGGPGATWNVDQWVYYYQQVTGSQVTGGQVATILGATNQSPTNRGALLTVDQFLSALPTAGLSGFGLAAYERQAFLTPQVLADPYNRAHIRFPAALRAKLGMAAYEKQAFVTPQVLADPYNRAQIRFPAAVRGMGAYERQAFLTPQVLADPYNRAHIRFPAGLRAMMPCAPNYVKRGAPMRRAA